MQDNGILYSAYRRDVIVANQPNEVIVILQDGIEIFPRISPIYD